MMNKKLKILIYPGLHSRPGGKFVQFCKNFESNITINIKEFSIDGKSLLGLMKTAPSQFLDIEVVTEAYKNKDEFDNDDIDEYLMNVFEEI